MSSNLPAANLDITLRSVSRANNGAGGTSINIPSPSGSQVGDVLLAQLVVSVATTNITPPFGWTMVTLIPSGSSVKEAVYYKVFTSSEPSSYTWTLSSSQAATGGISSFANVDLLNPINALSSRYNDCYI